MCGACSKVLPRFQTKPFFSCLLNVLDGFSCSLIYCCYQWSSASSFILTIPAYLLAPPDGKPYSIPWKDLFLLHFSGRRCVDLERLLKRNWKRGRSRDTQSSAFSCYPWLMAYVIMAYEHGSSNMPTNFSYPTSKPSFQWSPKLFTFFCIQMQEDFFIHCSDPAMYRKKTRSG